MRSSKEKRSSSMFNFDVTLLSYTATAYLDHDVARSVNLNSFDFNKKGKKKCM
jgi:hypothetical protein